MPDAKPPRDRTKMKLYWHPQSGHSHRVFLFLSLIGVEVELKMIDLRKDEHLRPEFVALNRFHQIPVLDDGGTVISDANAILVYLAKKYKKSDWLPEEPREAALVQRWLSVAAGELAKGPCAARIVTVWKENPGTEKLSIQRAHSLLEKMESCLEERDWFALDRPTIADVALYTYTAHAPEGNVNLSNYSNVLSWLERFEALPGFVPMMSTPEGLRTVDPANARVF